MIFYWFFKKYALHKYSFDLLLSHVIRHIMRTEKHFPDVGFPMWTDLKVYNSYLCLIHISSWIREVAVTSGLNHLRYGDLGHIFKFWFWVAFYCIQGLILFQVYVFFSFLRISKTSIHDGFSCFSPLSLFPFLY